jgi:hypothetical protein
VSSPSNRPNQLNQQKTREIKLPAEWHSSFPPKRTIKAVEMTEKRGACVGLLLFASASKKPSFISPDGVRKRASCAVFLQKSGFRGACSGEYEQENCSKSFVK